MRKRAILVYVDGEVYDFLANLAKTKGSSISQVSREIIMKEIKNLGCGNGKA